ncbi:hypothetical protein C8F01DRAFT_1231864 [Mycena amicta]|nr:hypothetical protein C8F01DRAFT_1231864 [Mycena amicta]
MGSCTIEPAASAGSRGPTGRESGWSGSTTGARSLEPDGVEGMYTINRYPINPSYVSDPLLPVKPRQRSSLPLVYIYNLLLSTRSLDATRVGDVMRHHGSGAGCRVPFPLVSSSLAYWPPPLDGGHVPRPSELTHLSINLHDLFGRPGAFALPTAEQIAGPPLNTLTHLNLFGLTPTELLPIFNHTVFPVLTHISLRARPNPPIHEILRKILRSCGLLRRLVAYTDVPSKQDGGEDWAATLEASVADPRFCAILCRSHELYWGIWPWTERDLFCRAEERIPERARENPHLQ